VEVFLLASKIALGGLVLSALIAAFGYLTKQPWRFKVVGYTGFLAVLAGGLFALSLAPIVRPKIEGAKPYEVVFDQGRARVVIAVSPTITPAELTATLQQARIQLFSPGRRLGGNASKMEVIARTLVPVAPGTVKMVILGRILIRNDVPLTELGQVELEPGGFEQLPKLKG